MINFLHWLFPPTFRIFKNSDRNGYSIKHKGEYLVVGYEGLYMRFYSCETTKTASAWSKVSTALEILKEWQKTKMPNLKRWKIVIETEE